MHSHLRAFHLAQNVGLRVHAQSSTRSSGFQKHTVRHDEGGHLLQQHLTQLDEITSSVHAQP